MTLHVLDSERRIVAEEFLRGSPGGPGSGTSSRLPKRRSGRSASTSTRTLDLVTKAQEYAALGTPEYWVVDLDRKLVVVHRLGTGRYEVTTIGAGRLDSSAIPAFWILVDWLRQTPPPPDDECLQRIEQG